MSYNEPPPPPQYGGQPPQYGGQPAKTSGKAIAGLVLGILGVFPCATCFIFSILAIVFGNLADKEIKGSHGALTGDGLAKWAKILGIVGIVLGILLWVLSLAGVIPSSFEYTTGQQS